VIVVNALFLQSRSLPVPVPVAAPSRPSENLPKSIQVSAPTAAPTHGVGLIRKPALAATAPRHDAIAKLIDQGSQIVAVQRALSDYGYGQLKPSGILDRPTRDAIERFEREHNIPITGKLSDRLVDELAVLIGRPLE
jgi:peptidoglycan hydrolase-like protein with peptidoglycan-binding domain